MRLSGELFDLDSLDVVHAYDIDITSCDDCKVCHHTPTCKYNADAMGGLIDKLEAIDTLIIASPVYFGGLTDRLMRIVNRLQQLYERKFTHDRPLSISTVHMVLTCGANKSWMFDGPRVTHHIVKTMVGAKGECFTFSGTDDRTDYTQTINQYKAHL